MTAIATATSKLRLNGMPLEKGSVFSIAKEMYDEGISGLRPILQVEGLEYKINKTPITSWGSKILTSWAHREILYGSISTNGEFGGTREECFIYHRTNRHYSFHSIPPLNDYAVLSIEDGVRTIASKEKALDIDNPDLPVELTSLGEEYVRAKSEFDRWREGREGVQSIIKMIPIRYLAVDKFSNGEIAWIRRSENLDGLADEQILNFHKGWELIRNSPGTRAANFNSLI